jgi:hypothetical protein
MKCVPGKTTQLFTLAEFENSVVKFGERARKPFQPFRDLGV